MIFLTLIIIMQNPVANGNPTVSTTTRETLHFTVQLDQNDWFSQLLNPCNHDTSGDQSSNDVLGVAGREAEVRTITGTTLSRLTSIEKDLIQEVGNTYVPMFLKIFEKGYVFPKLEMLRFCKLIAYVIVRSYCVMSVTKIIFIFRQQSVHSTIYLRFHPYPLQI